MEATEQIKAAILYLSGRCDGAIEQDGIGFNGIDNHFGNSLAESIHQGKELTPKQLEVALKMLHKYEKTQLADAGLSLPASNDLKLELATDKTVKQLNCKREMKLAGDKIIIEFDYDDDCYKAVKSMGGKFNPDDKSWVFPDSKLNILLEKLVPLGFKPYQEILEHLDLINEEKRIERENLQARVDWCMAHLESESEEWDFKPYRHQWEGVDFILSQPNLSAIVASQPGTGKTCQALIAAKAIRDFYRFEYDECPAVIVLCPVSLKLNWLKEAGKVRLKIEVFSHSKVPTPPQSKKFILISDENHAFKNPKAARTQKFLDLALHENCISCIPMTATPMINGRHCELYTTLKAVKHPIADNRRQYEIRYCDAKSTAFTPWDTTGSINAEELSANIANKMIRHTKEQCLDLPEKVFISLTCEPNKDADQEYQQNLEALKKEYLERLQRKEINLGGEQLVTIGQLRKCSSIRKSYQAIETVQDLIDAGQPVVIFTEFRESADRIADNFGVQPLNGDTKLEDRQQMVDDFQNGINNVFVGTIAAGGVGITLTRASYLIMMDSPWNPGLYTQATDRIHRIGQVNKCTIYDIYYSDIDYVIAALINKKGENIDRVINEKIGKIPDKIDSAFYEKLLKKLLGS
jgi:SNF2 family DNA or RNA helicase